MFGLATITLQQALGITVRGFTAFKHQIDSALECAPIIVRRHRPVTRGIGILSIHHLRHALEGLDLPPEACLVFEDAGLGLVSARKAGLDAIITVNGYTKDEDFSGALLVLDHLGEPDRPFTVLEGDAGGARWVDVDLLRGLHAARHG